MPLKDLEHDSLQETDKNFSRNIASEIIKKEKQYAEEEKQRLKEELQKLWLSPENDMLFNDI